MPCPRCQRCPTQCGYCCSEMCQRFHTQWHSVFVDLLASLVGSLPLTHTNMMEIFLYHPHDPVVHWPTHTAPPWLTFCFLSPAFWWVSSDRAIFLKRMCIISRRQNQWEWEPRPRYFQLKTCENDGETKGENKSWGVDNIQRPVSSPGHWTSFTFVFYL